jgi:hypothetical protein
LFRLPLRTPLQAESSLLSKRALTAAEAEKLLESLKGEASAMLLFLKNIESIEICRWRVGESEKERIFYCNIMNISLELRNKRSFVGINVGKSVTKVHAVDYTLEINCISGNGTASIPYIEKWEVCNQLGGGACNVIAEDPNNALLRLIPWGGVASCISCPFSHPSSCSSSSSSALSNGTNSNGAEKLGLAYCFLPLPILTGLPVMVNGFFELSSNRRDIWQSGQAAGGEMTGDGRTRAEWNLSLMRDVIAPSYVRLLVRARDILGFCDAYQDLFPSPVPAPWKIVVDATLVKCRDERLLFVESAPPKVPLSSKTTQQNIFSNTWITCLQAVLLPSRERDRDTDRETDRGKQLVLLTNEEEDKLSLFLLEAGQSFVRCSPLLRKTLLNSRTCSLSAIPSYVRTVLRGTSGESAYVPSALMCSVFLLQYCLSDLDPSIVSHCAELDTLPLLPLKGGGVGSIKIFTAAQAVCVGELSAMGYPHPRAVWALSLSGFDVFRACDLISSTAPHALTEIESASTYDQIYGLYVLASTDIATVFSDAGAVLVDCSSVGHTVTEFLEHRNMQMLSNLRLFEASLVPNLLRLILPSQCFNGESLTLLGDAHTQTQTHPPRTRPPVVISQRALNSLQAFLPGFWTFAQTRDDVIVSFADGAAVVPFLSSSLSLSLSGPVCTGDGKESQSCDTVSVSVSPLSRMFSLLAAKKGDLALHNDVASALQVLGVRLVDPYILGTGTLARTFWQYVHSPNRSGVLAALDAVIRNQNIKNTEVAPFKDLLTISQKILFRAYLSSCEPVEYLSGIFQFFCCFFSSVFLSFIVCKARTRAADSLALSGDRS